MIINSIIHRKLFPLLVELIDYKFPTSEQRVWFINPVFRSLFINFHKSNQRHCIEYVIPYSSFVNSLRDFIS